MKKTIVAALLLAVACASNPGEPLRPGGVLAPLPPAPKLDRGETALGRKLFFDPRLSGDATLSCANCHVPEKAFSDGLALSVGYTSGLHFRNTPTLINSSSKKYFYWDGRFAGSDLPSVVRDSISDTHFMLADGRLVVERLRQVPAYVHDFKKVYGKEPSYGRILTAVSAYCSSLTSVGAAFDRYLRGEEDALNPSAKRGLALFTGKAGCVRCHSGPMLTDWQFHDQDVPENPDIFDAVNRHIAFRRFFKVMGVEGYAALREDLGRYAVTKSPKDKGHFLTPSLREVARTAPYMHNGMVKTLDEAVALMGPELTVIERRDITAFLKSLSGASRKTTPPRLPEYRPRDLGKN